jgi:hypothetical protein
VRPSRVLLGLIILASGAVATAQPTTAAAPRYEAKVISQSPPAIHPPFLDGTFWLDDYLWLYFRDRTLGPGLFRKYRVCWTYESFSGGGCRNGLASRNWPKLPLRIKNGFNSNMTVAWSVNGKTVVTQRLRITGE